MNFRRILNINVKDSLANEVKEAYVLSKKGAQIVYDYNENLPEEYFEHLEFPVSRFWNQYFKSKLDRAEFTTKSKALDVCAGTGTLILNVMSHSYFDSCKAIDISSPAIHRLNQRIKDLKLEGSCSAERQNIMETSFDDNQFDAIVGNSFLHHLPNNVEFLKETNRILKKGGGICFSGEPSINCSRLEGLFLGNLLKFLRFIKVKRKVETVTYSDIWAYDKKSLVEQLEKTGFRDVKIVPFGFLVAIFNEPTSFILSKINGKSMQPNWYWALFGFLDRALFFWLPANWHSHFIITAKK